MPAPRTRRRDTGSPPRRGRRPRVTLDQLHIFLSVAQREHVTAAADALGLSQGSVSAAVHRLERTLGVPLLHRVGRNVRLTDVGRAVRHLAIQTLDDAGQIEELTAGYLAFEHGSGTQLRAALVLGRHANESRTIELEEGALLAALLAGIGFAVMPRSLVDGEIASGRLVAIPRPGRPVVQHFTAARRVALHTPAVDAFWQHLAAAAPAQG